MSYTYSREITTRAGIATVMLGLAALIASACSGDAAGATKPHRLYGDAVSVGNGTARTYVEMQNGAPAEIGVALSAEALDGLPQAMHHGGDPHADMRVFTLSMPANHQTPYHFVDLGWNPAGHEPPGIYDLPHFDFHFYSASEEVRNSIDPVDPAFEEKTNNLPSAQETPAGYILPMAVAVPRMGVHWVDPESPELKGAKFTTTFIYGSWDGEVIFAEPMITREFLLSKPDFSAPIAQPELYGAAGYYPTHYTIRYDETEREYRIALSGLTRRAS